jgi:hypothetical protein
MFKTTKFIHFHNNTDLPVMIDSWVDDSNQLQCLKVKPREKLLVHSSVGEWHINAMLCEDADRKIWREKGLKSVINIGKFRSDQCASGNYSWLEYDDLFTCEFSEVFTSKEFNLMTFSLK